MKKVAVLMLLPVLCLLTTACIPKIISLVSNDLLSTDNLINHATTVGGDNPPEALKVGGFSVTYDVIASFPGGTYAIMIDEDGLLTKKYSQPRGHEPDLQRMLTHEEQSQLIDIIFENDFFNLPKRPADGSEESAMAGSTSTFFTIAVDGKSYFISGSGNSPEVRSKLRGIGDFIVNLMETAEPLQPE